MEARLRRSRQQLARERVLIGFAVVGLVVPNGVLAARLARGETVFSLYALTGLTLATAAFLAWVAWDADRSGVIRWWPLVPAAVVLGLCFALPVYLLLRERALYGFGPAHRARRPPASSAGGRVWEWSNGPGDHGATNARG